MCAYQNISAVSRSRDNPEFNSGLVKQTYRRKRGLSRMGQNTHGQCCVPNGTLPLSGMDTSFYQHRIPYGMKHKVIIIRYS